MRKLLINPMSVRTALFATLFWISASSFGQEERATGLIYNPVTLRSIPYKAQLTASSYLGVPAAASLEKYCPRTGDQGQYGTCVGFATAYYLRTIMYAKAAADNGRSIDPNSNLFSPSFVYEQIKDQNDNYCERGTDPVAAFDVMRQSGVAKLSTQPYSCSAPIRKEALLEGIGYRITDYTILFQPNETDADLRINSVKKALAEGYPCMLGFVVAKSFYRVKTDLWREEPTDDGPTGKHGYHAMCIVGYDNNMYGGAFRVVNSWGTGWGDKGFVWIPYKDFARYAFMAIQAYGVETWVDPMMSGNVSFRMNTGEVMPASRSVIGNLSAGEAPVYPEELVAYKMNKPYTSGTEFRFFIRTNTDVFIYAFATDQGGKVNKILPFADNMSPRIGRNSTIAFPSETKVVRMDNTPGTDFLLILYSNKKLDVVELQNKMNLASGGLSAKIKAALGNQLILPSAINYSNTEIGFSLKASPKANVVPLMIAINHQ